MTDMTAAQAAQQNNRSNDGKYATKEQAPADDVSLSDAAEAAATRASAMKEQWRATHVETHRACLDAMRAELVAIYPNATHILLESSDQGDFATIEGVYDRDGNPALDRDGNPMNYDDIETAEDYAGFLNMDSPWAWEDQKTSDIPDGLVSRIGRYNAVITAAPNEPDPDAAGARADEARKKWHEVNKDTHTAIIESMRASVLTEQPDAAYIAIEPSDQGDYGVVLGVYGADGRTLLEFDEIDEIDELRDGADWLSVDNPHAWGQYIVDRPTELVGEVPSYARVIATR